MALSVIVSHPWCKIKPENKECLWAYIDHRQSTYSQLKKIFHKNRPYIEGVDLDREVKRILNGFIEWADSQNSLTDKIDWLISPFSRNPFANNIFLHITWLNIYRNREISESIYFVTENSGFVDAIKILSINKNIKIKVNGVLYYHLFDFLLIMKSYKELVGNLYSVITGYLFQLIYTENNLGRLSSIKNLIGAHLYSSEIVKGSFFYNDNTYSKIFDWLNEKKASFAAYVFPVNFSLIDFYKFYKSIEKSKFPIFTYAMFINLRLILSALIICIRYTKKKQKSYTYDGINITKMIHMELMRSSMRGLFPIINYYASTNLDHNNQSLLWYVDWFENQPTSRACTLGFSSKKIKVAGLRQYVIAENYSSLYLTKRQITAGAAPDYCWTGGSRTQEILSNFEARIKYARVPMIRYEYLNDYKSQDRSMNFAQDLLVLLPHSRESAHNLLEVVFSLPKSNFDSFRKIKIRAHIDFDEKYIRKFLAKINKTITFYDDRLVFSRSPIIEDFKDARIVISSDSGSAIEAVCCGIPVVNLAKCFGINYNHFDDRDSLMHTTAYSPEELSDKLLLWAKDNEKTRYTIKAELINKYFGALGSADMGGFELLLKN